MKNRPVVAELFHADGQTDRHDEANNRFFAILRMCLKTNRLIPRRKRLFLLKSTQNTLWAKWIVS